MSDIATLEQQIGGAISAASDEAALESVRVVRARQERLGLGAVEDARRDDAG